MSGRRVFLFFVLLSVPALSQQGTLSQHLPNSTWSSMKDMRPEPPRDLELRKLQIEELHRDAEQLAVLSTSLQVQLQQLQKGMLSKDLAQNLKKVEKLSKKLREEVSR